MRTVSQRELRNESGEIMRGLERGESYLVTRRGVSIGVLAPVTRDALDEVTIRPGTGGMVFPEGVHLTETTEAALRELRGNR